MDGAAAVERGGGLGEPAVVLGGDAGGVVGGDAALGGALRVGIGVVDLPQPVDGVLRPTTRTRSTTRTKRVLDREGNSSYYINNLHVRRRDVIDLFLGTGLGPRAYAIIGQGMISRIVEAKPEELRLYLEEAAGVTKYKERRRETEHRLEDARENIARVDDIRNELEKQVEDLQAQAAVAQQYRGLHEEMSRKQTLPWLKTL